MRCFDKEDPWGKRPYIVRLALLLLVLAALATPGCTKDRRGTASVDKLIEQLSDTDPAVRERAARVLNNYEGRAAKAIPALALAVKKDPDADVRSAAAGSLGYIARGCNEQVSATAKEALVGALADDNPSVKMAAMISLAAIGDLSPAAVNALRPLLRDERRGVRISAADALARAGKNGALASKELREALRDKEDAVRAVAAQALGAIGPDAFPATGDLAKLLRDPAPMVRYAVSEALGRIGARARGAAPALRELLDDSDRRVRAAGARALWQVTGDENATVPVLVTCLGSVVRRVPGKTDTELIPNERARFIAAKTLGEIGGKARSAIPALERARDEAEEGSLLRETITSAIQSIGE